MNTPISNFTGTIYQNIVKPIFFTFDAEAVHNLMVGTGSSFGKVPLAKKTIRSTYAFNNEILDQHINKIHFANPIGLAAGFDYDANLTQILSDVGFGFQTAGTVTAKYYEGNAKPRLGRLPNSKSLLVNKGFKSGGVDAVIERLKDLDFEIPLGISVGSTNKMYDHPNDQITDIMETFEKLKKNLPKVLYFELNISCPNLKTGEPFTTPKRLQPLLTELEKVRITQPIFIKMPTDVKVEEAMDLLKTADKFTISGAVFGNLTKDRKNPDLDPAEVAKATAGNFSGKPVEKRANALLSEAYRKYGKRYTLIGCGGTFSAEDAYLKIKLGASLVQMITGMIYQGPQVIGQINKGLVELLKKDGYEHISEAIGAAHTRR
jgi:dihydroorotate dehydrogenase